MGQTCLKEGVEQRLIQIVIITRDAAILFELEDDASTDHNARHGIVRENVETFVF